MDVNPWAVLALGPTAWRGYDLTRGLDWAMSNCRTQHAWQGSWDPYPHLIGSVDGFDFNDDRDVVWVEGTESMALALHFASRDSLADYFHDQMARLIPPANDGGLPYATNEGTIAADDDSRSTTYPSVAGTAWFIFQELHYNPFEIPSEAHPDPNAHYDPCTIVGTVEQTLGPVNAYQLFPNYPNPFNPETIITFNLPRSSHVRLQIFNANGQLVITLIDTKLAAGHQQIRWDGRDQKGKPASSGIYIYRLQTNSGNITRKMLLISNMHFRGSSDFV
jgi:hypothetical protein